MLSEKLKSLRKEKGVSQEKLAAFLNVSFQAVSKWENGNACPDIALLPDIARFFSITVDELLQVEVIDEKKLYKEYENRAEMLFRDGKRQEVIDLWLEAYAQMPNNVEVKEMLMSAYYDADNRKYRHEILELGVDICQSDVPIHYKGQAIREVANTYAANGEPELALKWAKKSIPLFNSQEVIMTEIEDGEEMIADISFCTYWFLNMLCYMACRIAKSDKVERDWQYKREAVKTAVKVLEAVYVCDDMSFEMLQLLCRMHRTIARLETRTSNDENMVKKHLCRALDCAAKSTGVTEHTLSLPLLDGWHIQAAPEDKTQVVKEMKDDISSADFDGYKGAGWLAEIENTLNGLL